MWNQRIGIHEEIVRLISSAEACQINPLMTRLYYRLLLAPAEWWDSRESLRVRASTGAEVTTTALEELANWLRHTPEEAHHALQWLHEKQVITYHPHESGDEIEISFAGLYFPDQTE